MHGTRLFDHLHKKIQIWLAFFPGATTQLLDAKLSEHGGAGVSLPEDIIFDVLSRLPAKDLGRFRCVSKAWRALISDPAFVAAQKSRTRPLLIGVFQGRPRKLDNWTLPDGAPCYRKTLELRVMDTHGNVLRVEDVDYVKFLHRTPRLDLVCLDDEVFGTSAIDPETGRAVKISGYVNDHTSDLVDESGYSTLNGGFRYSSFGRAAPSGVGVYKAVRLSSYQPCQIATLEDGGGAALQLEWRPMAAPPFIACCCSCCSATVNGVLFFMPDDADEPACAPPGWNRVGAFDLETEEWEPIIHGPAIEFPEGKTWQIALAELRGGLSMVQTVVKSIKHDPYINIWFLVDSEKSIWVKNYVIQMHKSWYSFEALSETLVDGRLLLLNFVGKQEQESHSGRWILQLYDPSTGAHTALTEMPTEFWGDMTLYRGSCCLDEH